MRTHAKRDANQSEIVGALRKVGATVTDLASVGGGCPDVLVGFRGRNYAMEIKDGSLPTSRRVLTPAEQAWHATWRGQCAIVNSVREALAIIGVYVGGEAPFG